MSVEVKEKKEGGWIRKRLAHSAGDKFFGGLVRGKSEFRAEIDWTTDSTLGQCFRGRIEVQDSRTADEAT